MSDNSVLAQFTSRVTPSPPKREPEQEQQQDAEGEEDFGGYGVLRGVRDRAVMLQFRRRDGSVVALNYTWLERVEFDASSGVTLKFGGRSVRVTGRNIDAARLIDALCRHRVAWIQEADAAALRRANKDATVIERIEIE